MGKENGGIKCNKNKEVLESLQRLESSLADLNDKSSTHKLSHWREIPEVVETSYKMLYDGSKFVEGTSTKYTLLGKINVDDGSELAIDLRKGCELLCTGALLLCNKETGCSKSTRHFAKQSSRAVVATVIELIKTFTEHTLEQLTEEEQYKNLAAQKTGAVWSACQNLSKVPKGNRNSIRRELFTWIAECNTTMTEFNDLVQLGPSSETNEGNSSNPNVKDDDDDWDDFCEGEEQYTSSEIPIAESCVALLKCSRGTINAALKACEAAGDVLTKEGETKDNNDNTTKNSNETNRKDSILEWINTLHNLARGVGEGVTDLGTLLYPPLDLSNDDLLKQIKTQKDFVVAVHEYILDASPKGLDDILPMPEDVTELSSKLRTTVQTRCQEAETSMKNARSVKSDQEI